MISILGIPDYSKPLYIINTRGALKAIFSSGKSSQLTLGMLLGWVGRVAEIAPNLPEKVIKWPKSGEIGLK